MSTITVKVNCSDSSKWYFDQNGLELKVVEHDYKYFRLANAGIHILKSDCSIVSEAIQESPEGFKEGRWMYENACGSEFLYRHNGSEFYQVSSRGKVYHEEFINRSQGIPATSEQIERVLSAVAVSKGYDIQEHIIYSHGNDSLVTFENEIYNSGTWAKIVDQDKPEEFVKDPHAVAMTELWEGKELESLPERWAIERTPENAGRINHWYNKKMYNVNFNRTYGFICVPFIRFGIDELPEGYILITDEQFDRWVLDKPEERKDQFEDTYKYFEHPAPTIMEDKLSIEEKKSIWELFQNIRKIGRFDSNTFFNGESECAPLFHTSIDNVPVWEGQ